MYLKDKRNTASKTITIKANLKPEVYLVQLMHNQQTNYTKAMV